MQTKNDEEQEVRLRKPLLKRSQGSAPSSDEPPSFVQGQGRVVPQAQAAPEQFQGAPVGKRWYHGDITLSEAQNRMRLAPSRKDGTYLVYDNKFSEGNYILLVYYNEEFNKFHIRRSGAQKYVLKDFTLDPVEHDSVRKLIKHHRGITGKSIKLEHSGSIKLTDCVVNPEHQA